MARKKKKKTSVQLPEAVAALFRITEWTGGRRKSFGKFGIVDLDTITVKQATHLLAMRFPYIEQLPQQESDTTVDNPT